MERIVFQKLIEWKDSTNRKPLILNGARQVGKTWLLEQLGDMYFDKVAYLVCRKNQALKDVFAQDVERFYERSLIIRYPPPSIFLVKGHN